MSDKQPFVHVQQPPLFRATLPWPPSVNNYYSCVRGRKIMSSDGRKYMTRATASLMHAGSPEIDEKGLVLSMMFYPPDNRRRDTDNFVKAVKDALVKGRVIKDDSQIATDYASMQATQGRRGYVEVTLYRAAGGAE